MGCESAAMYLSEEDMGKRTTERAFNHHDTQCWLSIDISHVAE